MISTSQARKSCDLWAAKLIKFIPSLNLRQSRQPTAIKSDPHTRKNPISKFKGVNKNVLRFTFNALAPLLVVLHSHFWLGRSIKFWQYYLPMLPSFCSFLQLFYTFLAVSLNVWCGSYSFKNWLCAMVQCWNAKLPNRYHHD